MCMRETNRISVRNSLHESTSYAHGGGTLHVSVDIQADVFVFYSPCSFMHVHGGNPMFSVDIFLVCIADQLSFLWMHMMRLCSVSLHVVWFFLTGSDSHVCMRQMFIIVQLQTSVICFMCIWRKPESLCCGQALQNLLHVHMEEAYGTGMQV